MSFIGGYQSDLRLDGIKYVGDFPLEHSLGAFGIATGTNNYDLQLNPQLTIYRQGMVFFVMFQNSNTGISTVSVSGLASVELTKEVSGALVSLDGLEIVVGKVYIVIYDGAYMQLINNDSFASENVKGILQLATQAEVNAGVDIAKAVTPAKLSAYIAGRIAPPEQIPGATELVAGIVQIASQQEVLAGLDINKAVTPAKLKLFAESYQTIPQAPPLASEAVSGTIKIATTGQVQLGSNDLTAVTPLKLRGAITQALENIPPPIIYNANEEFSGIVRLAGQDEVIAGTDQAKVITPATLSGTFNTLIASESKKGLVTIATLVDTLAGIDDTSSITPLKLKSMFNVRSKVVRSVVRFYSDMLEDEMIDRSITILNQLSSITVSNIPLGAFINKVTVFYEGNFRNEDNSLTAHLTSGFLSVRIGENTFLDFETLINTFYVPARQSMYKRYVAKNVPNVINGNGTYILTINNADANVPDLFVAGSWTIEFDYQITI